MRRYDIITQVRARIMKHWSWLSFGCHTSGPHAKFLLPCTSIQVRAGAGASFSLRLPCWLLQLARWLARASRATPFGKKGLEPFKNWVITQNNGVMDPFLERHGESRWRYSRDAPTTLPQASRRSVGLVIKRCHHQSAEATHQFTSCFKVR